MYDQGREDDNLDRSKGNWEKPDRKSNQYKRIKRGNLETIERKHSIIYSFITHWKQ